MRTSDVIKKSSICLIRQFLPANQCDQGSAVMILKIFSQKKIAKNWRFLTQNKVKLCKILIITLVFEKCAIFFAENWQKLQKIVIITSTLDWAKFRTLGDCLQRATFLKLNKKRKFWAFYFTT
jgi:hypothetical protein